jgi:uncharacterized protein (AIM24 family)
MHKLEADGWVFEHTGGTVVEHELKPGEEPRVGTGCVVVVTREVEFNAVNVTGRCAAL